jgi:hypothetical protein
MINYTNTDGKNLDSPRFLDDYTADELAVLKEKWKDEENRLKTADICGFNSGQDAKEVISKASDIDLSQEQFLSLQDGAKRYRFNQRVALEREAEKRSANQSTVEIYADLIKVKTPTKNPVKGGGLREDCKGFSENSRRRLIQKMAKWNLSDLYAYFITLTYPALYAADWKIWKRDLDTLFKRLERKYPELVGCCWRVEYQRRGAPHFHLIAVCSKACESLVLFRVQIAEMWAEIVAEGYKISGGDMAVYAPEQEKHRRAGTGVEAVQGRKQLMAYVSKYLAKVDQVNAPAEWGRNWGFRNLNGKLDFSPVEVVEIDYCEAAQLKRYVRRWLKSRGRVRYAGMLNMRVSYSVLGLGADSENGRVVYKLLGGIRQGLFASHISPDDPLELGCSLGVPFLERVQMGLYDARKAICEGDRVNTPLGLATVSQVKYCNVLGRLRCVVYLDVAQSNGVKLAAFEVWQCKAVGKTEQGSLWW